VGLLRSPKAKIASADIFSKKVGSRGLPENLKNVAAEN
jgi:hypothetical protein